MTHTLVTFLGRGLEDPRKGYRETMRAPAAGDRSPSDLGASLPDGAKSGKSTMVALTCEMRE